ncbi:MAG TPA: hypothetical protein PKO41_01815 [Dokdonella sp.]|uniref:hypothetical protein n=1 Tax=Dokdonella sp. TaxID=2291710 RepID=UPI0025BCE621|nr:hypothetical protein [Dokdonella sp.]MBX3691375.1 hypothetical protein [Dokdonella sp.]MCW5568591.1 hypothetical protein [Dokdonella sp.]HNR91138.1 hypothetical protein [Dokdonella sp.]
MTKVHRRYIREFLPAMAAYCVTLVLSLQALKLVQALWGRAALALLPALPILFAARALLRFVRDSDELQRRIQLEAFALASLVLTLGSFALGLLVLARVIDIAAGDALVMVLPAYALLYGAFAAYTTRRYQ